MILLVLFVAGPFLGFVLFCFCLFVDCCLVLCVLSFVLFYIFRFRCYLCISVACLGFVGLDGPCGVFLFTFPRFRTHLEGAEKSLQVKPWEFS